MEALYKHHIQVAEGQSPVDVRLSERPVKAYLVANLAFIENPEYAAAQYEISLGAVYAAMSFYEDNRTGIEKAIDAARAINLGTMKVGEKRLQDIRERLNRDNPSQE